MTRKRRGGGWQSARWKKTGNLLADVWSKTKRDGSAAWRLAGYYHLAIRKRVSGGIRGRPTAAQGSAWLGEFFAIERRCSPKQLPELLRHFMRAAPMMTGDQPELRDDQAFARYPHVLHNAARRVLEDFTAAHPEADVDALLKARGFPEGMLLTDGLDAVWSVWYVPQAIRTSLSLLVALNPKDEYPEARAMRRRFVLHIGGTNTGKTYEGFQHLKLARTGVYLAPLRLLALEGQETLLDAGVKCSLSTGEEEDVREGDTHVAATAEQRLDSGHLRGAGPGGPPVCRAGGQGIADPPHRELRRQLGGGGA